MTGTRQLLIADFRKSATVSDVQNLVAKLHRRGFWTTLFEPGSQLPAGAAGLAVILDDAAIRSEALRTILSRAQSIGVPVIAWLDGAESSNSSGQLPPSVILVQGHHASRDRALSRFANTIASAGAESAGIEHSAEADWVSPEQGQIAPDGAVWSWPGAMLGPLWPVAAGRPLAGFLGLALLIAGTVVAASLARSPLAPLVGFAGAWLAFAVLMGLFGGERASGMEERWFRPVGAFSLAVVIGFVALVGWSKAQSEGNILQPQTVAATGNPVLVGRQSSNWSWDGFMQDVSEFKIGGQPLAGGGDDFPPIVIKTPPPPPPDTGEPCDEMEAGLEKDIFCGESDEGPPA